MLDEQTPVSAAAKSVQGQERTLALQQIRRDSTVANLPWTLVSQASLDHLVGANGQRGGQFNA
jgi:hypothetical protein